MGCSRVRCSLPVGASASSMRSSASPVFKASGRRHRTSRCGRGSRDSRARTSRHRSKRGWSSRRPSCARLFTSSARRSTRRTRSRPLMDASPRGGRREDRISPRSRTSTTGSSSSRRRRARATRSVSSSRVTRRRTSASATGTSSRRSPRAGSSGRRAARAGSTVSWRGSWRRRRSFAKRWSRTPRSTSSHVATSAPSVRRRSATSQAGPAAACRRCVKRSDASPTFADSATSVDASCSTSRSPLVQQPTRSRRRVSSRASTRRSSATMPPNGRGSYRRNTRSR